MLGQSVYHNEMIAEKGLNKVTPNLNDVVVDGTNVLELKKNEYLEYIKVIKNHLKNPCPH